MSRMKKRFLDCSGMTMQEAESFGRELAIQQRDVMFYIADLARYAESRWPDTHHQVWPEWISPGMLSRAAAVGKAYPREEDRQHEAPYTIYMRESSKPDRNRRVQAHVDAGRNSDEANEANKQERKDSNRPRWLVAFDTHYFVHRHYYSGAGVETAMQVSGWIQRTVERLKEKGCTDVVIAFEGQGSFRKELTRIAEWEDQYKGKRGPKDQELKDQIQLTRELLEGLGFLCVSLDGYEADDILASYSSTFSGNCTIVSGDKDLRGYLSSKCNILSNVEWIEDDSGAMIPEYHWITAKSHTEETGMTPKQFIEYQVLAGDSVDSITGARKIGETGAKSLILEFGSADAAIQAAKDSDERLLSMKRGNIMQESLLEFESRIEITRKLVTLVTDLELPMNTRI